MNTQLVVATAFLASAVEAVEAVTIVLAVGLTRGWRAAIVGTVAGLLVLTVVVAALGPALVTLVPLAALQLVIGALLLVFGLQWLRKAVLRASGRKALHDEDAIFVAEVAELGGSARSPGFDWLGFTVAFKGVFLEGLEVAFIVLTIWLHTGQLRPAAAGALAAVGLVTLVAAALHRPLRRVPENAVKFAVGVALTAFGTFWGGEGVGVEWPLGDATLLVLLACYAGLALLLAQVGRRVPAPAASHGGPA